MFNLGWLEVSVIVLVAILIFGPSKIPELGSAFGKTLRGFKEEFKNAQDDSELSEDQEPERKQPHV
jgi:sec-independent protein translocase protein TatA